MAIATRRAGKWEVLGWLWLAYFVNQADRQIFSILLPLIRGDLHLTDSQVGFVATSFTLCFGLAVPLGGIIGDRFDRARVCTTSLATWSLATVATGVSSSLSQLIAFRGAATGAGEAIYAPANYSLIAAYHEETRSLAMSIHQTALYAGLIASGLIAGWLGQLYGWRVAFAMFGAVGMLVAIGMTFRVRDPAPARSHSASAKSAAGEFGQAVSLIFGQRATLLMAFAFAGFVFVNVGYLTWMPTLLGEKFGYSLARAGFHSMFWCHAFAFVGILWAGRFSDRLALRYSRGRLTVQTAGLVGMIPFILLMALATTPTWAMVGLAGFGLFRGGYDANIFASLYDHVPPEKRAAAASVMISFAFIAGAAAPLLLAVLKSGIGLSNGLALLAGGAAFAAICLAAAAAGPVSAPEPVLADDSPFA